MFSGSTPRADRDASIGAVDQGGGDHLNLARAAAWVAAAGFGSGFQYSATGRRCFRRPLTISQMADMRK